MNKEIEGFGQLNGRIIKSLWKQQTDLIINHPEGVKILINDDDPVEINAEISGPDDTPYKDGIFKVRLLFPNDFPISPPIGYFLTKIYHPNISEKGEICVNSLKKDWNPKNWCLYNIFQVIRCLLIIPFPESSLNQEAGKLFMEDYNEYYKFAKIYTEIHSKKNENKAKKLTQFVKQHELEIELSETNNTSKSKTKANFDDELAINLDLKDYLQMKTQKLTSIKINNSLIGCQSSPKPDLSNKNVLKIQKNKNFVSAYTDNDESGNKTFNSQLETNNENDKIHRDICNYKNFDKNFNGYILNENSSFKVATFNNLENSKNKVILNSFSFTNQDNNNAKDRNLFEDKQINNPKDGTDEKIYLKDFSFGYNSFNIEQNQIQDPQYSNKLELSNYYNFFNFFNKDNIAHHYSDSVIPKSEKLISIESNIDHSNDGNVSNLNKGIIECNYYNNQYNNEFESCILKSLKEKENQIKKTVQNIAPQFLEFNFPKTLNNQILTSPKTYKINNDYNTESYLIENNTIFNQIPFTENNFEEQENNYMFRESKLNLLRNNSSPNYLIQNHSIFKKKHSINIFKTNNNDFINLNNNLFKNNNYIPKDEYISQEISNQYSNLSDINNKGHYNFSYSKKNNLSPLKSDNKIKHSYLYSSFKSENCKLNPNYLKNKISGSKPSLVNLPMLRANNNYNNANYNNSLYSFIPKTNKKNNLKKYYSKTPNNSNKDEIQKWLSRL